MSRFNMDRFMLPLGLVVVVVLVAVIINVTGYFADRRSELAPPDLKDAIPEPRVDEATFRDRMFGILFDLSMVEQQLMEIAIRVEDLDESLDRLQTNVITVERKVEDMYQEVVRMRVPSHLGPERERYLEMFAILREELEEARIWVSFGARREFGVKINEIRDTITEFLR